MTDVLIKGRKRLKQTQGQHHVTMEAEAEVLHLQARDRQGWPAKHQKLEDARRTPPPTHTPLPEPSATAWPCQYLDCEL